MRTLFLAALATTAATAASAEPDRIHDPALGFAMPEGFAATTFADDLMHIRQTAMSRDGVIYVIHLEADGGSALTALKDDDGDGIADRRERFGGPPGAGVKTRVDAEGREWLYAAYKRDIVRWPLAPGELAPTGARERVVGGFARKPEHEWKMIAFDDDGGMLVMIGAPSNACMERRRKKGSPGQQPCPQIEDAAGVWRFDADALDQRPEDGEHFAVGLRNAVAFEWSGAHGGLYAGQMGRDVLSRYFPDLYTEADSAELPSEEFFHIERGDDLGWPYSYHDWRVDARMVMPEYGGDGKTTTDAYKAPVLGFPGHWAPSGLAFFPPDGPGFPARYRDGAFIAFKGGWNRSPLPQEGFRVVFLPVRDGVAAGPYETFADGFRGQPVVRHQGQSAILPIGLNVGNDGALYMGDQAGGRLYRITWTGEGGTDAAR